MSVSPVLTQLRQATGEAHRRLEDDLNLIDRVSDPSGRPEVMGRFLAWHEASHAALAPWWDERVTPGLAQASDARLMRLRRDVEALDGAGVGPVAPPELDDLGSALGWAYVSEGSALGRRMIGKELARRGVDGPGLGFFDPEAEDADGFRRLTAGMDRACADGRTTPGAVVAGALAGFAFADAVLCGENR